MTIEPIYRDPFPKTDLRGGYIGDGYLRCTDLPTQSFLKKGAKYMLLGGNPSPQLMKDHSVFLQDTTRNITRFVLNETSSLYQALSNDQGGQYQLTVVLENDLPCDGLECSVDTVRVVKVGTVYYEYVQHPCIQMAFYSGGRQIQARANFRPAQMCANSKLPHAMEACCRQEKYGETNATRETMVTYFYEGEREKYETARARCLDYGKDVCVFKRVYTEPDDVYFREGQFWTPLECDILVKVTTQGQVAIVHDALISFTNLVDKYGIPAHLAEADTMNWFDVMWSDSSNYPGSNESNSCSANNGKTMADGSCLMRTSVSESVVFHDTTNISNADILTNLFLGTTGPPTGSAPNAGDGFIAHIVGGVVDESTVFEIDDRGNTKFLLNLVSTVSLQGWTLPPQIYEAETASINNCTVDSFISERDSVGGSSGGFYVDFSASTDGASVEWNIELESAGDYVISFRYAMDLPMRFMSLIINGNDIMRDPANPTISSTFLGTEPIASYPLSRCQGNCLSDEVCATGLICTRNYALNGETPGCEVAEGDTNSFCVDPLDFPYGAVLYPTGDDRFRQNENNGFDDWESWLMTTSMQVSLLSGSNSIRLQVPAGFDAGMMIDHMKIEGLPVGSSTATFRNPPHFMSEWYFVLTISRCLKDKLCLTLPFVFAFVPVQV